MNTFGVNFTVASRFSLTPFSEISIKLMAQIINCTVRTLVRVLFSLEHIKHKVIYI